MTARTRRIAGRMFLLDPQARLLLMHDRVDLEAENSHWNTPGGGAEPGETPAEAAVREVFEETGLLIPLPPEAEPLHSDRIEFSFAGQLIDQTNHYFLVRVPGGLQVRAVGPTEAEQIVGLGHRWWSLAELEATEVAFYPVDTVALLRRATMGT